MDITRTNRARLDALMDERRLDLGLTWRDVAQRAGISYEAIRSLRTGTTDMRSLTLRKLDKALEWQPGSAARVLTGGDPSPLDPQPAPRGDGRPEWAVFPDDPLLEARAAEIWKTGRNPDGTDMVSWDDEVRLGYIEWGRRVREEALRRAGKRNGGSDRAAS